MLTFLARTLIAVSVYLLIIPDADASSDKIPWHLYLFGISSISTLGSVMVVRRKRTLETFGIRVMVGTIYFWVFTFIQLMILALVYHLS